MRAPRTRELVEWAAIAGVALALRLVHLRQIRDAPMFDHLVADGVAYDAWAREIASGHWLGTSVFYQAPLYPYFLATIYASIGRDLGVVRVVQAMLGVAACVLLGLAGTRFFGRRVGLLAALLLAIWPSAVFADGLVQKSALDVFFVCALLAAVATAIDAPRPSRWLLPGVVLGALALTRENALAFVPLLAGFVVLRRRRAAPVRALGWFALGLALLLVPVAVRNWAVGGELHLTTSQLGPNFFIGNNERATGGYRPLEYGRSDPRYERLDATELAERALGRSLSPAEVSRYWTRRALDFIEREPVTWLRLVGRKAVLFVNRVELGDAEDQYTYGDWSSELALLTPILGFGVLVPLAVAGIALTWGRGSTPLLAALLGLYALTVVGTFVMARYRHPMLPLLLLFAAAAVLEIGTASSRRRMIALVAAVAIALPANWPIVAESTVRAGSLYNIGRVLQDDGRLDESAAYYRRAIGEQADLAVAHSNLGTVLERQGRLDEARAAFLRAIALERDRPEYLYNLAHVEAARGDGAAAIAALERTLALDPANTGAHTNLGALLQERGDLDAALRHYDAAIAANPRNPEALNDRGTVLAQQGRVDDAIASFRAALEADSMHRSARENLATALVESGRGADAVPQLETLLAREPSDVALHARLGTLLASLGRRDGAVRHLETAVAIAERTGDAAALAEIRPRLAAARDTLGAPGPRQP